jgi:kanamycin kinase
VASWSLQWNFGPGHDRVLYDTYGIDADAQRIAFYRLLFDLG